MSFIPLDLTGFEESKPVPAGRYDLQIASVEETMTKEARKPQLRISITILGETSAPNLTHFVGLPTADDAPDKAQFKSLLLKRFLSMFKIPFGKQGFDLDAFPGACATGEVQLSEPDDSGNVYNRLVVPRMNGESEGRLTPRPPKR